MSRARFVRSAALGAGIALTAVLTAALARADAFIEPNPRCAGHVYVNAADGTSRFVAEPAAPNNVITTVYDNLTSNPNFAAGSNTLTATWGDSIEISQTGVVDAFELTVYNASNSFGLLNSTSLAFRICDPRPPWTPIATYQFDVPFPGGIAPGYYTTVAATDLSSLPAPLSLGLTHYVLQQTVEAFTGTATVLGIVSFSPPVIGSSPESMFFSYFATPGTSNFSNVPGQSANPGYRLRLSVVDAVKPSSWGSVKRLYR